MGLKTYNRAITVTSVFGVLISTYALYVEMAAEARPGFKALCDLSERASCSRVLTSEFSKGFGMVPRDSPLEIPNCIYGIAFYSLMIVLTTYDHPAVLIIQHIMAFTSVASSAYLAYLLAFVLNDFCIVCISTYIVNVLMSLFLYKKKQTMKNLAGKNK